MTPAPSPLQHYDRELVEGLLGHGDEILRHRSPLIDFPDESKNRFLKEELLESLNSTPVESSIRRRRIGTGRRPLGELNLDLNHLTTTL